MKRLLLVAVLVMLAFPGVANASQLRGAMLTPNWSAQGTPFYLTPEQQATEIAATRAMNGNVVRLSVDWAALQPEGPIDAAYQAQLDQAIAAARTYRQAVILNVTGTPCWASQTPACPLTSEHHMDPPRPELYAEVTRYLLNRYPGLYAYEIWNEPDFPGFWNGTVAQFATLANSAIAAAGRTRTRMVVGGFLRGGASYLLALHRAGLRGQDGISIHPYSAIGGAVGFTNPRPRRGQFRGAIEDYGRTMRVYGIRGGLYITEFGFAPCPAVPECVPARLAGRWLASSFRVIAHYRFVKAATAFSLRDYSDPADPNPAWMLHSGILGRPAQWQVKRTLKQLRSRKRKKR